MLRDYSPKAGANMHVSLMTIPENPVVGNQTQLRLRFDDGGALDRVVFPRPQTYRVWVQLQRNRVVNTVHFDITAAKLD